MLPSTKAPSMGGTPRSQQNSVLAGNGKSPSAATAIMDSRITAQTATGYNRANNTQMSMGGASAISNRAFNPMGSPANNQERTQASTLWNNNPLERQNMEPVRSSVPGQGRTNENPKALVNRDSGSSNGSGNRKKRSSMTKNNTNNSVKYPTLSPNGINKQDTAASFQGAETNYSFSPNTRDGTSISAKQTSARTGASQQVRAAPSSRNDNSQFSQQLSNSPNTRNITININNNGGGSTAGSNSKSVRNTQDILNEHHKLLNQTVEQRDISSGVNRPSRSAATRPTSNGKPQMGTSRVSDGQGGYTETTRTPHADGGGYTTTKRVVKKEVVQEKAPFTEPTVERQEDGKGGFVEITKTPWADGTGYTVTKRTVRKLNKTTGVTRSNNRSSGSFWNAMGWEEDANEGYYRGNTFSNKVIYCQGDADGWLNYRVNPEVFKHSQTYWRDRNQSPYWFDQNGCAYDDEGYLVYDAEGNWYDENGLICEDAMGNQYDYEGNVYDWQGQVVGGYDADSQTYFYYSQGYVNWLNQSAYGNNGWFDFPSCGGDVYGGMSRREEKSMRRKLRKKRGRVEGEIEREKRRLKKLKKAVRAEEVAGKREKKDRKREQSRRSERREKRSKSEKKEKKEKKRR